MESLAANNEIRLQLNEPNHHPTPQKVSTRADCNADLEQRKTPASAKNQWLADEDWHTCAETRPCSCRPRCRNHIVVAQWHIRKASQTHRLPGQRMCDVINEVQTHGTICMSTHSLVPLIHYTHLFFSTVHVVVVRLPCSCRHGNINFEANNNVFMIILQYISCDHTRMAVLLTSSPTTKTFGTSQKLAS